MHYKGQRSGCSKVGTPKVSCYGYVAATSHGRHANHNYRAGNELRGFTQKHSRRVVICVTAGGGGGSHIAVSASQIADEARLPIQTPSPSWLQSVRASRNKWRLLQPSRECLRGGLDALVANRVSLPRYQQLPGRKYALENRCSTGARCPLWKQMPSEHQASKCKMQTVLKS